MSSSSVPVPPAAPLSLTVLTPNEAWKVAARYGGRGGVTVRVPRLKRLGDALRVMQHLFPKTKSHGWVVEPAYMLKRVSNLDKALWDLWAKVDTVLVSLAHAIWFNNLLINPPGTMLEDDEPLPDMDVPEGVTAAAALLQEVQALGDDQTESKAAAVALLRGLLGAGNGTVRIAELREALDGMGEIFSQITALAVWTTNQQACRDLSLAGQCMIQALGVLQLPVDPIPLSSESLAARRSRLERLQLPMWHFKEAIEAVAYAGVSFQGYPTVQNLQVHLTDYANPHALQNYLQDFHAYGPNAGDLNDPKVLTDESERLYQAVLDDDFSSEVPVAVPSHYAHYAHYAGEAILLGDGDEWDGGDGGELDGGAVGEWHGGWCCIT